MKKLSTVSRVLLSLLEVATRLQGDLVSHGFTLMPVFETQIRFILEAKTEIAGKEEGFSSLTPSHAFCLPVA